MADKFKRLNQKVEKGWKSSNRREEFKMIEGVDALGANNKVCLIVCGRFLKVTNETRSGQNVRKSRE